MSISINQRRKNKIKNSAQKKRKDRTKHSVQIK